MSKETDIKEFQSLIDDPRFPQELLKGEGAIDRLQDDFMCHPAQFTRSVLAAMHNERFGRWDTQKGQELLQKLNLTKEDIVRWSL